MHLPDLLRRCGAILMLLAGCAGPPAAPPTDEVALTLSRLPSTQVLLLGEQHDAPEHQQLHRRFVTELAARGQLAALVLEMAPAGGSTAGLPAAATEAAVREALRWDERAWPWPAYGPAVMAAVRAGVPVQGGNLPTDRLRGSMAQTELDQRLPPEVLVRQQALIREGHCQLLPERQIAPMTRVQIARDLSMAQVIESALPRARPGQLVLLLSGSVHADKSLGVPRHLPPGVRSTSLRLQAGGASLPGEDFDARLPTPPAPPVDHCASLREQFKPRTQP